MTEYIMQNMPRILSRRIPLRTHTYVSASPLSGFCFPLLHPGNLSDLELQMPPLWAPGKPSDLGRLFLSFTVLSLHTRFSDSQLAL